MRRRWMLALCIGGFGIVMGGCGGGIVPTAAKSHGVVNTTTRPVESSTTTTTTTAPPPSTTTTTVPPTTTTAPSLVYPPTTLSQVKALAATGNISDFNYINMQDNSDPGCENTGIRVVMPQGVPDQQMSADMLKYFFQELQQYPPSSGCGGLNIDGYNSASDASPNGPLDGAATSGTVELDVNSTNPKNSLDVTLPDGSSFTVNY